MVGATVLGVFLQGLPPDRRVAMARVASLIRRAARGVRESKRFGLVFYELNGGPLFGLESREKSLTLYVAEKSVLEPFVGSMRGIDAEHSLIEFTDLNRLPLPDIEKLIRASVVLRREHASPSQSEILAMWGVKEEEARVAPPVVRISMKTAEDELAEAAAKAEAERLTTENKKILRPTRPEKSLVQKRAAAAAAAAGKPKTRKSSKASTEGADVAKTAVRRTKRSTKNTETLAAE